MIRLRSRRVDFTRSTASYKSTNSLCSLANTVCRCGIYAAYRYIKQKLFFEALFRKSNRVHHAFALTAYTLWCTVYIAHARIKCSGLLKSWGLFLFYDSPWNSRNKRAATMHQPGGDYVVVFTAQSVYCWSAIKLYTWANGAVKRVILHVTHFQLI